MTELVVVDFETHAIGERPDYPPEPVGLAVKEDDDEGTYTSFGHPGGNNGTEAGAAEYLRTLARDKTSKFVMHNAIFDRQVAAEKLGVELPWDQVECTMVQAFIDNPHGELALKPLSAVHLGMPPVEQEDVRQWLISNGKVKSNDKKWGAHIAEAPAPLVSPYAIGDTTRTLGLYRKYQESFDLGQHEAYRREMALMPHIVGMEQRGVFLDMPRLAADLPKYQAMLADLTLKIQKRLGPIDPDSDELITALKVSGATTGLLLTAKGAESVSKDSLIETVTEPDLLGNLLVRAALATCLRTFLQPWYEAGLKTGGLLYPRWNQVRNYDAVGARTGRFSSTPNMQNMPSDFEKLLGQLGKIGYRLDIPLPNCRDYIIARPGNILISADYSSQELRLLAHFTGGKLLSALHEDHYADLHQIAAQLAGLTRKEAKTLGFAILYGAGIAKIAKSLAISEPEAKRIKYAYMEALPEIKALQNGLRGRADRNMPIRTIGGRLYYCEPPKTIGDRLWTFEYKLTNYLIQGSAADQTKQAMLDFAKDDSPGELLLTVHDQLIIEAPEDGADEASAALQKAMRGAFADKLEYEVVCDETRGHSYGEL
jgi:DNA polymerase-1